MSLAELQELEDNLPIDPKLRNPKLGAVTPIRVVNEVFCSGDGNRGVQTAAFNLPNDERVVSEKGSKRVMLKNVQEAKFKKVIEIDIKDASDISAVEALPEKAIPRDVRPVSKKVFLDLLDPALGLAGKDFPEKIEGLAFGPDHLALVCGSHRGQRLPRREHVEHGTVGRGAVVAGDVGQSQ